MLRPGRQVGGRSLPSHGAGVGYGGSDYGYGGGSSSSYSEYASNGAQGFAGPAGSSRRGSRRRGDGSLSAYLQQPWVWAVLTSVLFFFMAMYYRSQKSSLLKVMHVNSLKEFREANDRLQSDQMKWRKEVDSARSSEMQMRTKFVAIERELEKSKREAELLKKKSDSGNIEERIKAREEAWKKQVQLLQKATSRESRRAAAERFGPGPHRVKVAFKIPGDEMEHFFIAEMAPLSLVPHAVHLFLQQVHHGLWDHTWIYLNGPHVMQWGPQQFYDEGNSASGDDDRALALKPFRDMQLDTLAFPEYSPEYPHVPWTLGFTGRPGGPDVYINKVDNTVAHGPGGQYQHDLEEQADPCFAKIVEGRESLEKVFRLPVYGDGSDYSFFLQDPIEVVKATVLDKIPDSFKVYGSAETQETAKKGSGAAKMKFKLPKIDHMVVP